jgi:hypothetical protein
MRSPLRAVPLLGGDPSQREAARDALLAFDEAIGPDRLELYSVRFERIEGHKARGSYTASQIYLQPSLPASSVGYVLRHELCHALDDAESLSVGYERELESFMASVEEPDPVRRRREAFAQICAEGPLLPELLSARCEGLDHGGLARWLAEEVWHERVELPLMQGAGEVMSVEAGFPVVPLELSAGWSDAGARLKVWGERGRSSLTLDPYTGAADADASLFRYNPAPPASPEADLPMPDLQIRDVTGSTDTAAAMAGRDGIWRLVVWDGTQWALVEDTCLPDDRARANLLPMDGRLWAVWGEGETLSWRPLTPR